MKRDLIDRTVRGSVSFLCVVSLLLFPAGARVFAQAPPPPQPPPQQLLSPDQLENLVAPIALYPDPLLSQVLAASTYPLEIVEVDQWMRQNGNLHGTQLMDAARQQNWDPSVQALVAFPDALTMLTRDVRWTTDLGNAFLAQQKDVMGAVQRMRLRAMQNRKLESTPQQNVSTQTQDGQSAVVIEPADPQVVYVPAYNPAYVWGPPAYGYYPPLWYPGIGYGFGFGPGIYIGGFFPGWGGLGWGGWGVGWGWGCGWFGGGLFVNAGFFNHYGFGRGYYGGNFAGGGRAAWQHDSFHRAGVAYGNQSVAARFNNARYAAGRTNSGSSFAASRSNSGSSVAGARSSSAGGGGWQRLNNASSAATRGSAPANQGSVNNSSRGYSGAATQGNSRGYSNAGASRASSAPNYSRSYSSPSAGSSASSSPRSSGGGFSGGASRPSSVGSSGASRPSSGGSSGGHSSGSGGGHSAGRR